MQGWAGGLKPMPAILGRRQDTFWTSHQLITGLTYRDEQALTLTPTDGLELPVHLTCTSLD